MRSRRKCSTERLSTLKTPWWNLWGSRAASLLDSGLAGVGLAETVRRRVAIVARVVMEKRMVMVCLW